MSRNKSRCRPNAWRPMAKTPPNRDVRDRHKMNQGYLLGILTAAAVLNDDEEFNFTNERLQRFMIQCDTLMYSMNREKDDARYIMKELERRTGLRLNFREGERPKDGRFAIVDECAPAADEWEE